MKQIAILLVATIVAFSSFAQSNWTPMGVSQGNILLSTRTTSKMTKEGKITSQFRLDYTFPMKSTDDRLVSHSELDVIINCFTRETMTTTDRHYARNGGKEIEKDRNIWSKEDKMAPPIEGSPGDVLIETICPKVSGKTA